MKIRGLSLDRFKKSPSKPDSATHEKGPSILRKLFLSCMGFGLFMGIVFPFFAMIFVEPNEGMFMYFSIACWVAGATIGLVNYALVKQVLVSKLKQVAEVTSRVGSKDLTETCDIVSHDVIGDIVSSVNRMTNTLREIIGEISSTSGMVNSSATEMIETMRQNSESVFDQRTQTDQVATAMNEMAVTVKQVAENASDAARAANDADKASYEGSKVVTHSIGIIDELASDVESAGKVIEHLAGESEHIGAVLSVIKGIAEQTNLLALNAAIEAARAGEQGRGFAVVADEVRTLASRTAESTQEIEDMIVKVQEGTASAVEAMELARTKAKESVDQIGQVSSALTSITNSVGSITEMNTQIAHAAGEQTTVANEINANVSRINDMSNETAEGVRQNMQKGEEMFAQTQRLDALVSGFKLN